MEGHETAVKTSDSTSFESLLQRFKETQLPFEFDSKTHDTGLFEYEDGDVKDTQGQSMSTYLLPRHLVEKWVLDSAFLEKGNTLPEELTNNLDIFYNDNFYWATIMPVARFSDKNARYLLVEIFVQIGATSGGINKLYAFKYDQKNHLTRIIELAAYGMTRHLETRDDEDTAYWKARYEIISAKLKITPPSVVTVQTLTEEEMEISEMLPVDTSYSTSRVISNITKKIDLSR